MPFLAAHPALREVLVSLALLAAAYVAARFASYLLGLAMARSADGGIDNRLLVHSKLFGSIGCRHSPVDPGHVGKGGLDVLQRIMPLPPGSHAPILGVASGLSTPDDQAGTK